MVYCPFLLALFIQLFPFFAYAVIISALKTQIVLNLGSESAQERVELARKRRGILCRGREASSAFPRVLIITPLPASPLPFPLTFKFNRATIFVQIF